MSANRKSEALSLGPGAGSVRRIVRNSTINLAAQGLNAVCNLAAVFVLARGLGKAGLGEFYTLFALLVFVQLLVEAGLSTVLTHRIARSPDVWKGAVAEASGLLVLVIGVSAVLLLAIGVAWTWRLDDPQAWVAYAWAAVACAGLHVQRFSGAVLQAFERLEYESLARVLQGVLFGGLVVVTVGWWRGGLQMAVAMLACSHVAAAVFLTACLQWRAPCLGLRLHSGVVRDWLAEAVPLGLGDVIRRLTWQLDTIVLRLLQPPAVVGVYSIAYRPLGPLNWLPRAILRAVFPTFARLAETDRAGLERAFAASIRLLWVTSLPIAVAIFVTAEPVIVILAGEEYLDAQGPMRVLIWVTSLSYLSLQFRFLFTALGRPRVYTVLVGLVLAVEAGLEFALIPWWGYYGACAGTLLGELLFTAIGLVACRWLGVGGIEWRALGAAAVAGALMGAALWPVRGVSLPLLILAVGLATAGYFLLCFALGALRWEELRRLSAQDRPVP